MSCETTIHGTVTVDDSHYNIVNSCTIGRDKFPKVDVTIETSQYISRKHLKMFFQNGDIYLICSGSNGIFVNGAFYGYGPDEIKLPSICSLRFPSTKIMLTVESPKSLLLKYPPKKRLSRAFNSNDMVEFKKFIRRSVDQNNSADLLCDVDGDSTSEELVSIVQRSTTSSPIADPAATVTLHRSSPVDRGTEQHKPPYSYAQLIVQSIYASSMHQLTLSEIYRQICTTFPYYKMTHKGWQNSIRHNLSLNRYFIRVPRSQNRLCKSAYWQIDKAQQELLFKQAFWKRKAKNFNTYPSSYEAVSVEDKLIKDKLSTAHSTVESRSTKRKISDTKDDETDSVSSKICSNSGSYKFDYPSQLSTNSIPSSPRIKNSESNLMELLL